jgi:hypothetical protein
MIETFARPTAACRSIELATHGSAYLTSYRPGAGPYECITRIGSNLWQCSTESVC